MYVCLLHFCVPWFVSKAWVMFPPGETIWFIKFESSKDPRWTPESSKDPRSTPESSKDPRSTPSKTSSNLSYCDCQSWNCSFCQSCSSCPTRSIGAASVFAFLRSQQKRSFYLDQLLFYKKMTRIPYPSKKRKLYAKIMESAVLDTTQDFKKKDVVKRSWLETLESLAASLLGMEGVTGIFFIGWEWRTLKKAVIAKPRGRKHLSKLQFSNNLHWKQVCQIHRKSSRVVSSKFKPPWLHMDHNSSRYESQKELDRAQWPVPNWLLLVVHPWQSGWSWRFHNQLWSGTWSHPWIASFSYTHHYTSPNVKGFWYK